MADSWGRKKSLVFSAVTMGIAMFYLGFYVRFDPPDEKHPVPPAGYVALAMVYIFAVCFQLGWGPVCWIYASEIPTARLRGITVALAAATQVRVVCCCEGHPSCLLISTSPLFCAN
jgi:MFS family permease